MENKKCSKCETVKPLDEFYIRRIRKNCVCSICKECAKKIAAELYLKNKEAINKRNAAWKTNNKEKHKAINREYRANHKEGISLSGKKHYQSNKETIKKKHSEYFQKNRESRILKISEWGKNNPDKARAIRITASKKRRSSLNGRIDNAIGPEMWRALRKAKAGRHWEDLVGYTVDELKEHLASKFTPKMNWDNYGSYWEIDHRIPKSLFKYVSYEDNAFKECWGLANLQPLPAKINRRKYNKKDFAYG